MNLSLVIVTGIAASSSALAREMSDVVTPSPSRVEATSDAFIIEDAGADIGEAIKVVGPARGGCTKPPGWTTLAAWNGSDHYHFAPAQALRPACLMPLPFKPDAKGTQRLLAARIPTIFGSL
ncbi:MAG: hypothetical protein WCD76_19750 [Pyrinomonadaceae bacterium]